jgi:methionyl aminopeptidase
VKIFYKSPEEINKLRKANVAVATVLQAVEAACKPGATTWDLNEIAAAKLKELGAKSAFLGYAHPPYPAVLCTSINSVIVHGIPRKDEVLKAGDIIGIDFGCFVEGYCGDSAKTVLVGEVSPEARKLVEETKKSLDLAIEQCRPGKRLQDISWAVQSHVEALGYSIVRAFVGHGIGKAMHEDPPVPNYKSMGPNPRLKAGLVLAVEPMVNAGDPEIEMLSDQWTAVTKDRSLSAHFEHSIAITEDGPFVLSRL